MSTATATRSLPFLNGKLLPIAVAAAWLCASGEAVQAAPVETGNPDLKFRWDNTVKYSAGFRVKDRSEAIMADFNGDDGDRNFSRGLISNRIDLLSEMDVSYKSVGFRVSGAAWYDDVYNKHNDNNSPATSNNVSVPHNKFTRATRNRMGRKAELLDAFVYGKGSIGDMPATLRVGQHTLVFGESIFFGANGIGNAQGPIDLVKLLSIPGSQFKEVLRPVQQVSGQLQLSNSLSLSAYYQFEWDKTILPPAGSYLSSGDVVGEGAERAGPFLRTRDLAPKNSGQGGVQLRAQLPQWDAEVSVFAARYHDKTPNLYLTLNPTTFAPQGLQHVYAEGIRAYGASLSTVVGSWNVAGEVSVRDNAPLVSDPVVFPAGSADNRGRPAYAIGKTLHAQLSGIYLLTASPLWQGGSFLGEIAWNRRASIERNANALDPNTTRDALAMRVLLTPNYFQVLPGLDIGIPIGLGYTVKGKSSAVSAFGPEHGGDFSIGVNGDYEQTWQIGLNYVHFFGREQPGALPPNAPQQYLSFGQPLRDRNFISMNIKRAF
jgi:hypothetical protein